MAGQININGTSREELVKNVTTLLEALRAARAALQACQPHPRDYQTLNPAVYSEDTVSWRSDLLDLESMEQAWRRVGEFYATSG